MSTLRRASRLWIFVGALLALAGCDDGEVEPTQDRLAGLSICGPMRQIVEVYGSTLRGPYLGVGVEGMTFTTRNAVQGERLEGEFPEILVVRSADADSACLAQIQTALVDTCDYCRTRSTELCLLELEAAVSTPSHACVACGDGRCTGSEDAASCPQDCHCGDGVCDLLAGEVTATCPEDCPASCGNGACEALAGEACICAEGDADCVSCAADCCVSVCGDGTCDALLGETLENCEQDCGAISTCGDACDTSYCGDGRCIGDEHGDCRDCFDLPVNCTTPGVATRDAFRGHEVRCGDGICTGCEPLTCRTDCADLDFGVCTAGPEGTSSCPDRYCGDGVCDGAENYLLCPWDCTVEGIRRCNNGVCEDYDLAVLAADGQCDDSPSCGASRCGDGFCQASELEPGELSTGNFCPADCGAAPCPEAYQALCADDPTRTGRRCATAFFDGQERTVIADCGELCPVLEHCGSNCADVDGEPTCDVCPIALPADAEPCLPTAPWQCVNDEDGAFQRRCEAIDPSVFEIAACFRAVYEPCPNGCDPHTRACKP